MKNEVNLLNSDIRIPTLGSCYCLHLFIYSSIRPCTQVDKKNMRNSVNTPVILSFPAHLDKWTNGWIDMLKQVLWAMEVVFTRIPLLSTESLSRLAVILAC